MKPRKTAGLHRILIVWVGLMASVGVKGAEPAKEIAKWANLNQLSAGQQIQVVLNDAKSYRGRFQSVSEDTLTVRLETGEQSFDRKSVLRVSAKAGSHRLRNAALGGLIGIAAGAGIGAAAGRSAKGFTKINTNVDTGAGAIIGLGAGVGVGAALPAAAWRTFYRAR